MQPIMKGSPPRGGWRTLVVGLLSGAGLWASGCGADVSSYRDYVLKSQQASCERTFRCCNRRCSTTVDTTFNGSLKNVEFTISTGLQRFNAAKAQACLDAMTSLYTDCSQYADTVDISAASRACSGILQGALPVGVGCSLTNDNCGPNSYCVVDTSTDPSQARCRRTIGIGEACDSTLRCSAGSTCSSTAPRTCVANLDAVPLDGVCNDALPCGAGLVCLQGAICGEPLYGGKLCSADVQCLSRRCAVDTCTVPMSKPTTVSDLVCGGTGTGTGTF